MNRTSFHPHILKSLQDADDNERLSVLDVAHLLQVSDDGVRWWIRNGRLAATRVNSKYSQGRCGAYVITVAALKAFLQRCAEIDKALW